MATVIAAATSTAAATLMATATATAAAHMIETLIKACNSGHVTIVCSLLKGGVSVNASFNGVTPIMAASASGKVQIVNLLLDNGAKVNIKANNGLSALMMASSNGHIEVVKLLLDNGAKVNIKANNRLSALMMASSNGHIEVVKLLLDNGAKVNIKANNGLSALMIASGDGHTKVVKILLDNRAEVDMQSNNRLSALMMASINGHNEVVKLLLEHGAKIDMQDNDGESALLTSSANGHIEVVKLLLELRASIANIEIQNNAGQTSLIIASANGHNEVVKFLLEHGAKVNMQENNRLSALMLASKNGHIAVVKLLLDNGANVNMQTSKGVCALIMASIQGHIEVVKCLLEFKAEADLHPIENVDLLSNINVDLQSIIFDNCNTGGLLIDPANMAKLIYANHNKHKISFSPLLVACVFRHIEIVRLLLDHGVSVNKMYRNFLLSPLILACVTGQTKIVKLLLAHGAEVNMASATGLVPLIGAINSNIKDNSEIAIKERIEMLKLLLEHGAKVNMQCEVLSPLISACLTGHVETIKLLIEHGADVNMLTNNGHSALIMASANGIVEVVKVLLDHGALVNMQNDSSEILKKFADGQDPMRVLRDLNRNISSPLEIACIYGHIEIVRLLLDRGARVNVHRNCLTSPLIQASSTGHSEIAKLLLARGADINMANAIGEVPLQAALCSSVIFKKLMQVFGMEEDRALASIIKSGIEGHIETVKLLLEHGAQVNIEYNNCGSPLHMAIFVGSHTDAVKLLLDHGADVNIQDDDGLSPLHIASFNGGTETRKQHCRAKKTDFDKLFSDITASHIEMAGLLLDYGAGAQVNIQDKCGQSPLMMASSIGDAEMVKFLLDHGAEVNLKDKDGCSALAIASLAGNELNCTEVVSQNKVVEASILQRIIEEHTETVKVLLDFGAEVDSKDHHGFSAQMIASSNGHIEILQLLIDHGSKIDFKAIDIAREKNHVEVAELLSSKVKAETSSKTITSSEFMLLMQEMKSFEDRMNQRMEQMHNYTVQKMEQMYSQIMLRVSALPNLQGKSITLPHQQHSNDLTHANLLRELMDLACDWNIIGILLEMPDGTLDTIQCDHPSNARQCLLAMLKEWLKIIDPAPSWERMAGAVEQINQKKAHDLREKYCTQ